VCVFWERRLERAMISAPPRQDLGIGPCHELRLEQAGLEIHHLKLDQPLAEGLGIPGIG